jgi:hypothetical protein
VTEDICQLAWDAIGVNGTQLVGVLEVRGTIAFGGPWRTSRARWLPWRLLLFRVRVDAWNWESDRAAGNRALTSNVALQQPGPPQWISFFPKLPERLSPLKVQSYAGEVEMRFGPTYLGQFSCHVLVQCPRCSGLACLDRLSHPDGRTAGYRLVCLSCAHCDDWVLKRDRCIPFPGAGPVLRGAKKNGREGGLTVPALVSISRASLGEPARCDFCSPL